MYKIRLNDGTELDVKWCGVASGILSMCVVSGLSFLQIAQIFTDANKTCEMTYLYGTSQQVYQGYTDLTMIDRLDGYIISLKVVS